MALAFLTGKRASETVPARCETLMTATQITARPPNPLGSVAGLVASVALAMATFAYGTTAISQVGTAPQTATITVAGTLSAERPADYAHAGQRFAPQRSLSR